MRIIDDLPRHSARETRAWREVADTLRKLPAPPTRNYPKVHRRLFGRLFAGEHLSGVVLVCVVYLFSGKKIDLESLRGQA